MATPQVETEVQSQEFDQAVLPYVLPEQGPLTSISEATEAFWQKYGNQDLGITSYESYLVAKKAFEAQEGNIEVAIFGGGYGGTQAASRIRESFPHAHVVMFEQSDRIGGMGVDAISPFVGSHAKAKGNTQREAMKLMTDPGVDVITKYKVEDKDIAELKERFGFKVMVDARGSEPNKLQLPYGPRVMNIFEYLAKVNTPFDADGHFGRVHLPFVTDAKGAIKPGFIVGGGNAGRDLQVANELVVSVDAIEQKFGIPRHRIAVEAIAAKGSRIVRESLGIQYPANGVTQVLYRKGLEEMKVSKLLRGAAKLDTVALGQKIREEARLWQQADGGLYVGYTQIVDVKDDPSGGLLVTLENTKLNSTNVRPASFIAAATGFQKRAPIPGTVLVGIPVEGRGDLASTAVTVRGGTLDGVKVEGVMPEVLGRLKAAHPSPRNTYETFLQRIAALQIEKGQRSTTGEPADPIKHAMDHAPAYIIQKAFLTPKKVEQPAAPVTITDSTPVPVAEITSAVAEKKTTIVQQSLLESNLHAVVALLPFVESGIVHKGDVEIVPVYHENGTSLQSYELMFHEFDGEDIKATRSLGIRITAQGLENQAAPALPWGLVKNSHYVTATVYSRSQIQAKVVLSESFDESIKAFHSSVESRLEQVPSVPYEYKDSITSLDQLRTRVYERRIARAKSMILSQLRDPVTALAMKGGYNLPQEVGLPHADMLNVLMNLQEEDIVIHRYNIGAFDQDGFVDRAEYITFQLRDVRSGIDTTRELPLRMLGDGIFQIRGEGNQWVDVEDVNELRGLFDKYLTITIPKYEGDGVQFMDMFHKIVRGEQGALAYFYMNTQIPHVDIADEVKEKHRAFLLDQFIVSPEGNMYLKKGDTRKMIHTNRQLRREMKKIYEQRMSGLTDAQWKEVQKERRTETALYTAATLAGVAVSAGMNYLVKAPQLLGILSMMIAPSMASMSSSFAEDQQKEAFQTPEYTKKRTWRRLAGAAFWFLTGVIGESGIEMATGTNPITAVTSHADTSVGVEVAGDSLTNNTHPTATHVPTPEATQTPDVSIEPVVPIEPHVDIAPQGNIYIAPETATQTPAGTFDFSTISEVPFTEAGVKDYMWNALGGKEGWVGPEGYSQFDVMWSNYLRFGNDVSGTEAAEILKNLANTTSYEDFIAHHSDFISSLNTAISSQ